MAPRTTGYSGTLTYPPTFRLRGFHPLWRCFPTASARLGIRCPRAPRPRPDKPDGLGWSPFARRYSGSRFLFPLLWVLRCFSSPGSPAQKRGDRRSRRPGSPIRTSRDPRPLPAPPGLSQVATSFIGSGAEASTVGPYHLDPSKDPQSPSSTPAFKIPRYPLRAAQSLS